jgi:2'-5' RNA ligase
LEDNHGRTRYVLVVRLPRSVEVLIEDVFLGLAGATKPTMGYHITVLGPFYLDEKVDYRFLTPVQQVCVRWQPFEVDISTVSFFEAPDDNAVYLRVLDGDGLIELHDDLLSAVGKIATMQNERIREWNETLYAPHVTLALKLSDKELPQFLRKAASQDLHASFMVHEIWLCRQEPHAPWQYVAHFLLGTDEEQLVPPVENR